MVANHPLYQSKPVNGKIIVFDEYLMLAPKGKDYPKSLKKLVTVYEPVLVPIPQPPKPLMPPKNFKRGLVELSVKALGEAMLKYGISKSSMTMEAIIDHVHTNSGNAVAIWDSGKHGPACLKIRLEQNQPYSVPVVRFYRINQHG